MKKFSLKSVFIPVLSIVMALFLVTTASAMTPSLTVTSNGTGSLQVSVYGDANASVILDYYSGNQLMGAGVIGYTNYSGYFSGTINSYQYNIPTGASAIVVVDGQQSPAVVWPSNGYNNGTGNCGYYNGYYTCNNNGGYTNGQISLSQSNVSLTVGQSQTVTIYNGAYNNYNNYNYSSQYYVNNSSNGIVSGTINGNVITIYGQSAGSGSLSVCSSYGGGCATLYVTVTGNYNTCTYPYNYNCNNNGYGNGTCGYYNGYYTCNNYGNGGYYNTPLSVSNSNVQVTVGNTGSVTIYGANNTYPYNNGYYGYNNYYVTSNNSGIANATINGSILSIYGTTPGSTTITVCSSNGGSQCATIYVTVTQPMYIYNSPYNYPTQPGNWYYSNTLNCWCRQ